MSGPEIAGIVLGGVSIAMLLVVVVLLNKVYVVIRRDTQARAQAEEQPDTDAE